MIKIQLEAKPALTQSQKIQKDFMVLKSPAFHEKGDLLGKPLGFHKG